MSDLILSHPDAAIDYREEDHVGRLSGDDRSQCASIARALLEKKGWTGAQLEFLEAVEGCGVDDPFLLDELTDMRDAREREEALRA